MHKAADECMVMQVSTYKHAVADEIMYASCLRVQEGLAHPMDYLSIWTLLLYDSLSLSSTCAYSC